METNLRTTHLAFVGDYVPRRCGIATFTADICEAIAEEFPKTKCIVGSVNDRPEGYDYPGRVRFEIAEQEIASYSRAAEFLNINNVEVLSVQHEFGIYGGPAGSHLLALLRDVRMPVVTTLHTVLQDPSIEQRTVMAELDRLSSRLIVMAERGRSLLETVYGVAPEKIDLISHGVIDMPFMDSNFYKDEFGVEGRTVLLTFGLLSPNKGIENVIEAMPAILKRHPDVVYIVLGATHPNLIAAEGEKYRRKLESLAKALGVQDKVIFHNRFVSLGELKEFIGAADIYITPYLNEAQVTSGTLAYTFGAGKAIISTPYWHAQGIAGGRMRHARPFRQLGRDRRERERDSLRTDAHDRDAQESLETGPRDDLAGGGAALHGELRAGARGDEHRRGARRRSRRSRATGISAARVQARPPFHDERPDGDFSARHL